MPGCTIFPDPRSNDPSSETGSSLIWVPICQSLGNVKLDPQPSVARPSGGHVIFNQSQGNCSFSIRPSVKYFPKNQLSTDARLRHRLLLIFRGDVNTHFEIKCKASAMRQEARAGLATDQTHGRVSANLISHGCVNFPLAGDEWWGKGKRILEEGKSTLESGTIARGGTNDLVKRQTSPLERFRNSAVCSRRHRTRGEERNSARAVSRFAERVLSRSLLTSQRVPSAVPTPWRERERERERRCTLGAYSRTLSGSHHSYKHPPEIVNAFSPLGAAVVWWSDCPPPTKANRVRFPAGTFLDFRTWRIVTDAAAGRRAFSVFPRFPRSCILALLHTQLASPSSAPKTLIGFMPSDIAHGSLCTIQGDHDVCVKDNHAKGRRSDGVVCEGVNPLSVGVVWSKCKCFQAARLGSVGLLYLGHDRYSCGRVSSGRADPGRSSWLPAFDPTSHSLGAGD
ncbi:hypothetical protein PR048_023238 [Dryococelus australis]|uniref:Uncharacterized protein n=1 Tax=Dryococelus australis TaxID=614101 RepID=A0ABQ9GTL4_9NEOP|nr:hypothetical protein PR048_023238 [Dryococelus australis]